MNKAVAFIKKEIVFTIAFLLALATAFVVTPDSAYIDYVDFRTIGLLFVLMAVVAGFSSLGVMNLMARFVVSKVRSVRTLVAVLWGLCFFSSMIITNDVALITFVPLAIGVLRLSGNERFIIYTIVLQTVAANLGSMLTPMGNPQNLYLYTTFNVPLGEFMTITFPVILISAVLLILSTLFVPNEKMKAAVEKGSLTGNRLYIVMYIVLAVVAVAAVLRILDYKAAVAMTFACLVVFDRKIFKAVDWFLLLTFCAFFIFVGNVERIDGVHSFISELIKDRELFVSFAASQVISNVPAAVMLSGFTDNYRALVLGTDVGGLGTLIASLASLISFKLYMAEKDAKVLKYVCVFTVVNVIYLLMIFLGIFAINLV